MRLRDDLSELVGTATITELGAGRQSRVFDVVGPTGERYVAKVLDAAFVTAAEATARVDAVAELADLDPRVCRPIPLDGALVSPLASNGHHFLVICYEFAEGSPLDPMRPADAQLMGTTLARLHRSLRSVGHRDIGLVAALHTVDIVPNPSFQLLHGDFNHGNLRRHGTTVRVFDFDDCGYGPAAFDVANALYMVLFDSMTADEGIDYARFETAFLTGYRTHADRPMPDDVLHAFVDLRVRALDAWLADPSCAPIGIRTATPQWHDTLRSFVSRYRFSSAQG